MTFKPTVEVCHTWFVLRPLCDFGGDLPLALDLTVDWLQGLFSTHWSTIFFFFSTFGFLTVGTTPFGSLAFTNFTSLVTLTPELLSLVYPNPILSEKDFLEEMTSSSFLVETQSTLAFA